MTADSFNPGVLKFCAWLGPTFTAMWLIGAAPIGDFVFVPPPSASDGAAETVANYTDNLTQVRIGIVLMTFASALYIPWGMAVSMYARRAEAGRPILFYIQVVSLAACAVVILFIGFFWAIAAFRPGDVDPEITQTWNDAGWFGVLFTGAPFTMWAFALAAAIFLDRSERPAFPRWVAYLNIWAGLLYIEACLMLFFKTGAFSQNGAAVFYLPVAVFFGWIITLTVMTIRAVNAESRELESASPSEESVQPGTMSRVGAGSPTL